MRRVAACLLLLAGIVPAAQVHEVRPGYLQIQQVAADTFDVLWKVPVSGEHRLGLYARLPKECAGQPTQGAFVGAAFVERWRARCPGGLVGKTIRIDVLSGTRTDVLARVERLDGTTQTMRLNPEHASFVVTSAPDAFEVVRAYFVLGVEHIPTGVDHLLYVLALLFFNVGVEAGQLLFIAAVVTVLSGASRLLRRQAAARSGPWAAEDYIRTPVAYLVGSVAAFWVVQRVVAFWP